jgi:hypothetical protein
VAARPQQARYDAATRTYAIAGSVVPLLLIAGIFSVKYVVGVELAMAPRLMRDPQYALTVAGLYGAFTGIFIGRAARLWRLALRPADHAPSPPDPPPQGEPMPYVPDEELDRLARRTPP